MTTENQHRKLDLVQAASASIKTLMYLEGLLRETHGCKAATRELAAIVERIETWQAKHGRSS